MNEGPPDKPNFRVIEGGKRDLPEKKRETLANGDIRGIVPLLDAYLANRPADKEDRSVALRYISDALWALPKPDGGPIPRNGAMARADEKFGKRPRYEGMSTWRDWTEDQVQWDENYVFEYARIIAENREKSRVEKKKTSELEDFLDREAAKHYADEDKPTREE